MAEDLGRNEAISLEEAKHQVALASRRLGLLHLAFAETLVQVLGEEKGRKVVVRAIEEYSRKIGQAKADRARAAGLEPSAETFFEMSDLPSIGMHEGVEEVEVDGEIRFRAYGCVMGRVWRAYGADSLGRIYCYVDPASSMVFDTNCKFVHTKCIPDGDDFCELVMRPTTIQDREDFESTDTDWDAIETRKERRRSDC
jgi:hypothetical protein